MFAEQPSPDGHGVDSGRNSVAVPLTVKIVDATLVIVASRRRRSATNSIVFQFIGIAEE